MGQKEKQTSSWRDTLALVHGKQKLKKENYNLSYLETRISVLT